MTTARDVKQRIKSVKNISQVTRALQAVSASKVRKAIDKLEDTRPYSMKAWQVLKHIVRQPDREKLHPLCTKPEKVERFLVILIGGSRGLAGAYNTNVVNFGLDKFNGLEAEVRFVTVGEKSRDLVYRHGKDIYAEFNVIPDNPIYTDVTPIGRLAIDEFLAGNTDEIHIVYTQFVNRLQQNPTVKKLLPLEPSIDERVKTFQDGELYPGPYIYEPDQDEILEQLVPRFTMMQVFHAVLESLASEHSARMVAMKSATDNASDLADALQLQYNKARQQEITREMLDIAGGAEAISG
ncbi:MAG: ATP synthase F1 subunit gamma [Anaerolineales bacterium]